MNMKKENRENKKSVSNTAKLGNPKVLIYGIIGIIAFISVIFMLIESGQGSIRIKNKSDLKLEYVKTQFVYWDSDSTEQLLFDSIETNDEKVQPIESVNLVGTESNLELRFKFEGYDEFFIHAGYFNDTFSGNIKVTFDRKNDDIISVKLKGKNGILPSKQISLDESYDVYLEEGYVAE